MNATARTDMHGPPETGTPNGALTVLGIETSCDETAASVVRRTVDANRAVTGAIQSNVVRSQLTEHAAFGGVVPEIAARAHVDALDGIVRAALADAEITLDDLDAIAATAGPGLIGGVMIGLVTGQALALAANKPLVGVNHLEGHALTVGLTDGVRPPYLLLLVSGGHTQLVAVDAVGRYVRLGTTIDDALGEAFDKTAKLLGLGYPGGPEVERRAALGNASRFALPTPLKGRAAPDFSFAGLKTAVRQAALGIAPLSEADIADICASFQRAVTVTLADRVGRGMASYRERAAEARVEAANQPPTLVVAGGVAANRAIGAMLAELCATEGFRHVVPPPALCTDNGAMIAWAGAERLALRALDGAPRGFDPTAAIKTRPRWPLDELTA